VVTLAEGILDWLPSQLGQNSIKHQEDEYSPENQTEVWFDYAEVSQEKHGHR
jgi:hypothetical protein